MNINLSKLIKGALLMLATLLSACGGGSDGSSPVAVTNLPAQGLWGGNSGTGYPTIIMVLGDGTYYGVYMDKINQNTPLGFIQGTGTATASPGTFSSSNLKNFFLGSTTVRSASLTVNYTAKQSFNGTITYEDKTSDTFNNSYSTVYETAPTLSALAGNYTGDATVLTVVNISNTQLSVSSTGAITSTTDGCTLTGTATSRSEANAFNVTLAFSGSSCNAAVAGKSMAGLGFYNSDTRQFFIMAPNAERSGGVFYVGVKP